MAASLEELAYDLAQQALSRQRERLRELRGSAATLVAASALVASLLGGRAIDSVGLGTFTIPALVAFAATLLPAVTTSTNLFAESIEGPRAFEVLVQVGADTNEAYSSLATWLEQARAANVGALAKTTAVVQLGGVALVGEVVLFLLALSVR
jgi:hypothetical protein